METVSHGLALLPVPRALAHTGIRRKGRTALAVGLGEEGFLGQGQVGLTPVFFPEWGHSLGPGSRGKCQLCQFSCFLSVSSPPHQGREA